MHAGALKVALGRLGTTARVLYVAAHPDDENTRLLTYLANKRELEVGYLSLTRGGGGQNLIGTEQSELLAAIRTQELLAARRTDGARQFFTRARDFGYSKSPDEALDKWGEQAVLSDVVRVIRGFRPDLIITRFTEAGPSHGHHTASARLARAAVKAAQDPKAFPEQLKDGLTPHKVHRLMLNAPRWGRSDSDTSGMLALDVGGYDPRLGLSYPEIAAKSRTMHKSQGFGSAGRRGPVMEYFQTLVGPTATRDLLDGITVDWGRYDGGKAVQEALRSVVIAADTPETAVPGLLRARAAMRALKGVQSRPRIQQRVADVDRLLKAVLGLHIRAQSERAEVSPGERIPVNLQVTLRRPSALKLTSITWPDARDTRAHSLVVHEPLNREHKLKVSPKHRPSVPRWMDGAMSRTLYPHADFESVLTGAPEADLKVSLTFTLGAEKWVVNAPVVHAWTDRVHGERIRPVSIMPALTVTPAQEVVVLPAGAPRSVALVVRAGRPDVAGSVGLNMPKGWSKTPEQHKVHFEKEGQEKIVRFEVRPPSAKTKPAQLEPFAVVEGNTLRWRYDRLDYSHIPVQSILRTSGVRAVPMDFQAPKARTAYVPGSGDTIAEHLQAAGMRIEQVPAGDLNSERLRDFDVIVLGIRAFNTQGEALSAVHPALMDWVKTGGHLVVQYNTSNRWRRLSTNVGPYPLVIDRGRVTDETASMKALQPSHRLLQHPHTIGPDDFESWVQERGLYFASTWDKRYTPIFESHDPGETPLQGSLLYAKHGRGSFIYTGLSFFRQLPAGVPGAYRLLANLLSPEPARD